MKFGHLAASRVAATWILLEAALLTKVSRAFHSCSLVSPSPCPVGSGVRAQCHGHRDTQCELCTNDHNYSSLLGYESCMPCSKCLTTETVSRPCTASQDTQCVCIRTNIQKEYDEKDYEESDNTGFVSADRSTLVDLQETNQFTSLGSRSDAVFWDSNQHESNSLDGLNNTMLTSVVVSSLLILIIIAGLSAVIIWKVRRRKSRGINYSLRLNSDDAGPPRFTSPLENGFARVGNEVALRCVADGYPTPAITWLKDGHSLELDDNIEINDTELVIRQVSVNLAGRYRCEATNQFGTAVTYANLTVIGVFCESTEDLPSVETTMNLGLSVTSPDSDQMISQAGPDSLYNSELQEQFLTKYPGSTLRIIPHTDNLEWNDEGNQGYLQRMTEQVSHYSGSLLEENMMEHRETRTRQLAELGYTELAIGHISGRIEATVGAHRTPDCDQLF